MVRFSRPDRRGRRPDLLHPVLDDPRRHPAPAAVDHRHAPWSRQRDREAVADVLADLAGLSALATRAPWREVERVLEARFEWERLPLDEAIRAGITTYRASVAGGEPARMLNEFVARRRKP